MKYFYISVFGLLGVTTLGGCATTVAPAINAPGDSAATTDPSVAKKDAAVNQQVKPIIPDREVGALTRVRAFEGTILAIDTKKRKVSFLRNDGKIAEIQVAVQAGDLTHLKVGDQATFELAESVELRHEHETAMEENNQYPAGSAKERESYNSFFNRDVHASGIFQETSWTEVIEVPATVVFVDEKTRTITLKRHETRLFKAHSKSPEIHEGTLFSVRLGPEIENINEYKPGDAVVAHFKEIADISVKP